MKIPILIFSIAVLAFGTPLCADVPEGYRDTELLKGLKRPCGLAFLPDGRLLIIEQYTGKILLWDPKSPNRQSAIATIPDGVYTGHNESGLVGVCVDPDAAKNGFFYTFHTASKQVQRVLRWTLEGNTAKGPKVLIDNLPTRGANHNGGGIGFGPDGKFYVGVGEDGRDQKASQDLKSLKGKILRYNPDGTVPKDNPFPDSPVYAYGFRNPFRFTFQPGTGRLFVTDNGPDHDDEINIVQAGKNYGWPKAMGSSGKSGLENPVLSFTPTISITGIAFYTGKSMPGLKDHFFVCDYNYGNLYRVVLESPESGKVKSHEKFVTDRKGLVDVAVDPQAEYLYYCTLRGGLYRVEPDPAKK